MQKNTSGKKAATHCETAFFSRQDHIGQGFSVCCQNLERVVNNAYHPETDGQTKHINTILEQFWRAYVNHQQLVWVTLLPFVECSYNNIVHGSRGESLLK